MSSPNRDPGYDAILLLSFGGPEGRDDVMPFLRNVVRGKNVPDERLLGVAEHYYLFDGVSPINAENRALLKALQAELRGAAIALPLYWGNRNWHPLLADTMAKMASDGVKRALAFATSAYSSYSSCRQYLEDIDRARSTVGPSAPEVVKLRPFFNHPRFIEAQRERLEAALDELSPEHRETATVLFTAHSIPRTMAEGCEYARELEEVRSLVSAGRPNPTRLVYQSRSGPPTQPWLEPDVLDVLRELGREGAPAVVLAPVGFVSGHMEVIYDLDVEAAKVARELSLPLVRARTVSSHPRFVTMVRELIEEQLASKESAFVGALPPRPTPCPVDCCPRQRVIE